MPYTHTTLATARAQMQRRLADTSGVFWTSLEIDHYIREAIRVLNALTGTARIRTSLSVDATAPLWNLHTATGVSTYRAPSIRDREIISQMQYHLLEPDSPGAWTGTAMFTLDDLVKALTRRRNRFLLDTHSVLTRVSVSVNPIPTDSRVTLDQSYAYVQRVAWTTLGGHTTPLTPSDEFAASATKRSWQSATGVPLSYSVSSTSQLELQLIPHLVAAGTLDLLVVQIPADLDPTAGGGTGTLLGIPDDFAWCVKYGALADLLSQDGPSRDTLRAEWAEQIYQLGVRAARKHPFVLGVEIGGQPVIPGTLQQLDMTRRHWQTTYVPSVNTISLAANYLAAPPLVQGGAATTIDLDIVRNAEVPAFSSADNLQIRKDHLDAVLGWAEHIALLKCSGAEWQMSSVAASRMLQAAEARGAEIVTSSPYVTDMYRLSTQEFRQRPYRVIVDAEQQFQSAAEQARIERLRDSARGGL